MFTHYLEALLFRTLFRAINLFSLSAARRIGRFLGLINFHIIKVRCDVVEKQLRAAFPHLSEKEIRNLVREINISYGYTAIEFCWFSLKTYDEVKNYLIIDGKEHIEEALSFGRGCIIFSGHFGNWELEAQVLGNLTGKIYAVAKEQKNQYFNTFINRIRESNNLYLIPKKGALRGIVDTLKVNKSILMLGDQNAGKTGIPLNFFGMLAQTNPGTAKIALKFNTPVIFAVCYRLPDGKFHVVLKEPLMLTFEKSLDKSVQFYTQLLTSELEQMVRKHPEQWFWFHRRWLQKKHLIPEESKNE
ncbi:MAG: lysophospholipid acyltransferase family protein [Candidatus Cloacimonetes bacterium]|nr:lysophospholipid acyltransferase family protein [Candidatus Cloacimonadota bacterium]